MAAAAPPRPLSPRGAANQALCLSPVRYSKRAKPSDHSSEQTSAEEGSSNLFLFGNLTDDLLFEILTRIDYKSVTRYRSVCKRWFDLISHPRFMPSFIRHRHQPLSTKHPPQQCSIHPLPFTLALQFQNLTESGSTDNFVDLVPLDCKKNPFSESARFILFSKLCFRVKASFNDLLLLQSNKEPGFVYYICNPLTNKWLLLPPLRGLAAAQVIGLLCEPMCYGCSPSVQCSYTVVHIDRYCEYYCHELPKFKVNIFSSQTCEWRSIIGKGILPYRSSCAIGHRGKLHWVGLRCNKATVVVFDPFHDTEQCSLIDAPGSGDEHPSAHFKLGVCGGRLCLFQKKKPPDYWPAYLNVCVWELEEEGDDDCNSNDSTTWCLKYKVSWNKLLFGNPWLPDEIKDITAAKKFFLGFHATADAFFLKIDDKILLCNLQTMALEVVYQLKSEILPKAFPLVHPWWPTPVNKSIPTIFDSLILNQNHCIGRN